MASLRNAIPQRPYRERAQPGGREKLGILEKHKDYSARAKDYNAKKAKLKSLRQKATDRNPDEFHFGMMSSRTKDGIKLGDRGAKALSQEVVKLMKTQDAGYLRTVRERVRRERIRLEEAIQIVENADGAELTVAGPGKGSSSGGKHTVFVDNTEEQSTFDTAEWFDTDQTGLGKTYNRPRRGPQLEDAGEDSSYATDAQIGKSSRRRDATAVKRDEQTNSKKADHDRQRRTVRLEALKTQERELLAAEEELAKQRARMANTIGGVNKNGVKFRVRERKR